MVEFQVNLRYDKLCSPIGSLSLVWQDAIVRALDFSDHEGRFIKLLQRQFPGLEFRESVAPKFFTDPLEAYFAGDLTAIDHIPAEAAGTPFQKKVWAELRNIPAGSTISYGQLADRIGNPAACRAVGLANGSNPIAIIVPCHRVIGSQGSLTGYGGGIERKRWLLAHEGITSRLLQPLQPE